MLPISGQAFIHNSDLHWVMINVLLSISLSQSLMLRTEKITVKKKYLMGSVTGKGSPSGRTHSSLSLRCKLSLSCLSASHFPSSCPWAVYCPLLNRWTTLAAELWASYRLQHHEPSNGPRMDWWQYDRASCFFITPALKLALTADWWGTEPLALGLWNGPSQ